MGSCGLEHAQGLSCPDAWIWRLHKAGVTWVATCVVMVIGGILQVQPSGKKFLLSEEKVRVKVRLRC